VNVASNVRFVSRLFVGGRFLWIYPRPFAPPKIWYQPTRQHGVIRHTFIAWLIRNCVVIGKVPLDILSMISTKDLTHGLPGDRVWKVLIKVCFLPFEPLLRAEILFENGQCLLQTERLCVVLKGHTRGIRLQSAICHVTP
jgi:hypothetical protein